MTPGQKKKRAAAIERAENLALSSAVIAAGVGEMLRAPFSEPGPKRLSGLTAMLTMAFGMAHESERLFAANSMCRPNRRRA